MTNTSTVATQSPAPTLAPVISSSPSPSPQPIVVPTEYQDIVLRAVEACPAVPVEILAGQIQVESEWNPKARSPAGARGIAQFMKPTWKAYSVDGDGDGKKSIWNPADAIVSASVYNCALLKYVRDVPGDRTTLMLAAYNAGPGSVRKYEGVPPYPETQQYVEKVLSASSRIVPFWLSESSPSSTPVASSSPTAGGSG